MPSYSDAPPKLIGGERCLDFLNTVEWRGDPDAHCERLAAYDEFVLWAAAAGYVGEEEKRRLLELAGRRPHEAKATLKEAVQVREALARLVESGPQFDAGSLAAFNELLQRVQFAFRITLIGGAMHRVPVSRRNDLRQPLDRIILNAIDLITSERVRGVSHCGNARCGWFFLDVSRNKSRRWCDMATCGNLAKVHAHRERRRAASRRKERR